MDKKQIGTFLKQRRKQLGITQVEIATLSGISTRKLSDIETSKSSSTIDTLNKVCDILGCELNIKIKGT